MTVKEFAKIYGVSERRVQYLIKQGRIPARKVYGNKYIIEDNAIYPKDNRYTDWGSFYTVRRKPKNE